jgi:hypothetical protein
MTHKRNRQRRGSTPEALAARLPHELRSFGSFTDPGDLRSHWAAVADWLNTQVPGQGEALAVSVMNAAGLDPASWYRQALSRGTT